MYKSEMTIVLITSQTGKTKGLESLNTDSGNPGYQKIKVLSIIYYSKQNKID